MKFLFSAILFACFLTAPSAVSADFVYTEYGEWEGTVIEEGESRVQLKTPDGGVIAISKDIINEIVYTAEEDAERILSKINSLVEEASFKYENGNLREALSLYNEIYSVAAEVRERAGPLYDEALRAKREAEKKAEEIKNALAEQNISIEDEETGPKDLLREKGIDFSAEEFINAAGMGKTENLALFLEAGMEVNIRGSGGKTALMEACAKSRGEAVNKLLSAGATVNLTDDSGKTALHYAMESENIKIINIIVETY
jgi:hypothetical protein